MTSKQRPVSPFMIGPYYKPQMTSIMSISHRACGVFLSIVGAPLFLWWLVALGSGPESYAAFLQCMGGLLGKLALVGCAFCLSFHLCNGIRHLVWDTGRALEIDSAYRAGWIVLAGTVLLTATLAGVWL